MADTADLIVLGAYYGTGNKGEWVWPGSHVTNHVTSSVSGCFSLVQVD